MRKGSFLLAVWSKGMDGWSGSPDWKHVDGMLVSDGSPGHPTERRIMAPYQPQSQDYAIEAKIQLIDPQCGAYYKEFGLIARATKQGGIIGGFNCDQVAIASTEYGGFDFFDPIASQAFTPGTKWHIYRLAVKGNQIRPLWMVHLYLRRRIIAISMGVKSACSVSVRRSASAVSRFLGCKDPWERKIHHARFQAPATTRHPEAS